MSLVDFLVPGCELLSSENLWPLLRAPLELSLASTEPNAALVKALFRCEFECLVTMAGHTTKAQQCPAAGSDTSVALLQRELKGEQELALSLSPQGAELLQRCGTLRIKVTIVTDGPDPYTGNPTWEGGRTGFLTELTSQAS